MNVGRVVLLAAGILAGYEIEPWIRLQFGDFEAPEAARSEQLQAQATPGQKAGLEPHGHDDVQAGLVARGADHATTIGIYQANFHNFFINGG